MKTIINRKTGLPISISEAKSLCQQLKVDINTITTIEHKSVCGYPTPELAMKANLRAICEAYEGYIFAYVGTVNDTFEGYKVFVIGIQKLPADFEIRYPNYVIIG